MSMEAAANGHTGGVRAAASAVSSSRSSSSAGKKKMTIKPFKVKPQPPADFEDSTFHQLESAVDAVYAARSSSMSQEELYRAVESLCLHKKADALYSLLNAKCEHHIAAMLSPLRAELETEVGAWLSRVCSVWQSHCTQMLTLRSVFLYLDRTFVIHMQSQPSLWEMGLQIFASHFTADGQVERKTRDGLLLLIERERKGESVPRSLVRILLRMYSALRLYSSLFEPALYAATSAFYQAEAAAHLSAFSLADYLHHVTARLHQENDRLSSYLDPSSSGLIPLVETAMVRSHSKAMLESGFHSLLHEKRQQELSIMYGLYARVDALGEMKDAWSAYIRQTGAAIVGNEEKEQSMVADLLQLKASLDALLAASFASSPAFLHALKLAFESFLNSRENKPAEMIAKHLDRLLRSGGQKGATAEELQAEMERVMFLFRYIHGKDVFQAFYKKDLARRLLLNRSASVDAEKAVISCLRTECGASFTNKLEGMFKDMELSKEVAAEFQAHLRQQPSLGLPQLELAVQVLTMGNWPAYAEVSMAVPEDVGRMQEEFKSWYTNKNSGRRLAYVNGLSTAILRAFLPRGKKELQVSGMQAVVLMCFNPRQGAAAAAVQTAAAAPSSSSTSSSSSSSSSSPASVKLSFNTLLDMTKLPAADLKRTLQSLCLSESVRLLLKEPRSKTVSEGDSFSVDASFRSPLFRIKVPSLQLRETKEEQKAVTSKVFEDRQYAIDAAIVRIMKARKTLPHAQLMSEVITAFAAKFPVKPGDIKKRIGTLIDREYMERDKDNSQLYNYQA